MLQEQIRLGYDRTHLQQWAYATYVWKSFALVAGFKIDQASRQQLIIQWWTTKSKNEADKLMLQATPIIICWKPWKNRCAIKYGGKPSNLRNFQYEICMDNFRLMTSNFPHIKWPAT